MSDYPDPVFRADALAFRDGRMTPQTRSVPEETAIAVSYDRVGYAVMMATPQDFEDFAIGFSLSEAIIGHASEIIDCEVVTVDQGIECRMRLSHDVSARLTQRRRHLAGALGCGLCGLESLAEANRSLPRVTSALTMSAGSIMRGMRAMQARQALNRETHGVHAAGFFDPANDSLLLREDVGRHNALDKVIGSLARSSRPAAGGAILMTSRVSIELIQKCALLGAPIIVAVSVPTAHAIRTADIAGITLAAVARDDGFELFTHQHRIQPGASADVA